MIEEVLFAGFGLLLGLLMWEDFREQVVDDRKILVGIIFVLPLQLYLGRGWFAVEGAVVGGLVAGGFWVLGKVVRVIANSK